MSGKQVYELTIDDFDSCSVWFFPMDDTVEDELTVRPLSDQDACTDFQILVRTVFFGVNRAAYYGYLYWSSNAEVEYLKPVVLSEEGEAVTFWNGIVTRVWESSEFACSIRSELPLSYVSEPVFGLPSICGKLEGLYYLSDDQVCCVK
ncbi:hypothetical protein [Pseudomonas sp. MUP55]|uniref:hypothetical protein n=1 Tax=Pseudomonas sp. MUP55 TaxID=3087234 RepID=UPI002A5A5217|nr:MULTISPECIES: hypothetical protein [unclassified Pseudomonas]WPN92985.1 hypothetical protein SC319_00990 [Pseudomonas sp. MUP56]WPN98511.1 hypothetical protein SC318_00990 [Pseudomonas sp. MUP55]